MPATILRPAETKGRAICPTEAPRRAGGTAAICGSIRISRGADSRRKQCSFRLRLQLHLHPATLGGTNQHDYLLVGTFATGTDADTGTDTGASTPDAPGSDPAPAAPDTGEPRVTKTLRFGPATRGDLRKLLDRADALGLYVVGTLDIGPMTDGDVSTMAALGASLGLDAKSA